MMQASILFPTSAWVPPTQVQLAQSNDLGCQNWQLIDKCRANAVDPQELRSQSKSRITYIALSTQHPTSSQMLESVANASPQNHGRLLSASLRSPCSTQVTNVMRMQWNPKNRKSQIT